MTPEQCAQIIGILERHTVAIEQIADGVRFLLGAVISDDSDQSEDGQSTRTMDDQPLIGN